MSQPLDIGFDSRYKSIRKTVKIKKTSGIVKKVNIASKAMSTSNKKCVKKATKSKSLNIAQVPPISPITKEKHSKRNRHVKGTG